MIVDMHIHIVGAGDGGTGCHLSRDMRRSFTFRSLIRLLRVERAEALDAAVREQTVHWIGTAGLDAAVLLAQDAVRDEGGRPLWLKTPFYTPNEYVASICRESPSLFFGASVHPARPDALQEIDRCAELGAVLLKIHPVIYGIDLRDPAFGAYFRHAASLGLPVLIHCGLINALFPRKRHAGDPPVLRQALDVGATVIAAHAGRATPITHPETLAQLREMMAEYPHLYADTAALAQPFMIRCLRDILADDLWRSRLVHGSDFPVPPVAVPLTSGLSAGACWSLLREPNPILRDVRIKQAMGCPDEIFARGWRLMRT